MKIPLRYQVSEYDCGQTSLINALNYLFEREEIPVTLLRIINKYTLDLKGKNNITGEQGTSSNAIEKIFNLIEKHTKENNFNISYDILKKESVTENKIRRCLNNNGCVLARCYLQLEHYIIITKIDDTYAYIFDPYYVNENYYDNDCQVYIVRNQNNTYNRAVKINRLFSQNNSDYSLMEVNKREVVLINRNKS